jgi:regulator of replication initiation timing
MPIKNHEAIINLLTDENARLKQEVEELKEKLRKPIRDVQKKSEVIQLRKNDVPIQSYYGGCGGSGGCGGGRGGC